MATQRLRKTFKYPSASDDEDAVEEGMDEQGTEDKHTLPASPHIRTSSSHNTNRAKRLNPPPHPQTKQQSYPSSRPTTPQRHTPTRSCCSCSPSPPPSYTSRSSSTPPPSSPPPSQYQASSQRPTHCTRSRCPHRNPSPRRRKRRRRRRRSGVMLARLPHGKRKRRSLDVGLSHSCRSRLRMCWLSILLLRIGRWRGYWRCWSCGRASIGVRGWGLGVGTCRLWFVLLFCMRGPS